MKTHLSKKSLNYKGHVFEYDQPGKYCPRCDEVFFSSEDLQKTFRRRIDFKRRVDYLLTPDEIRSIRIGLGLTQDQAAEIFGGGVNAFSKYERGEAEQGRPLDLLLRLMRSENLTLAQIREPDRAFYKIIFAVSNVAYSTSNDAPQGKGFFNKVEPEQARSESETTAQNPTQYQEAF